MKQKVITFQVDNLTEMRRLNKEGYLIRCHRCYSEVIFNDSEIKCSKNLNHIYTTINNSRFTRKKLDISRMRDDLEKMKNKGYSREKIINKIENFPFYLPHLEYFDRENLEVTFEFDNFNTKTGNFDFEKIEKNDE